MFSSISYNGKCVILLILEDAESSLSFFVNKGVFVSLHIDVKVLVGFVVMLVDDNFIVFCHCQNFIFVQD